ncbi:MAG: ABC transporter permease [Myxococcales bacterium]|nr:ABC transporter permease [Myxococcales bacterium]
MFSVFFAEILIKIAIRNLFSAKLKSLILGSFVFAGTILVVVGNSLLDSIDDSMSRSIVDSFSGHIQVYSDSAKDELSLFGGMIMGREDIGKIDDFAGIRNELLKIDNVLSVIPMGIDTALVQKANTIDVELAELRDAVRTNNKPKIQAKSRHIRRIVGLLEGELKNLDNVARTKDRQEDEEHIRRAASAVFWSDFSQDPLAALEFLENKIAPLSLESQDIFLRYIGTNIEAFKATFPLFEVVKGNAVPNGRRGFMFNDFIYETQIKHKVAVRIDTIKKARDEENRMLATDEELQQLVRQNVAQFKEVAFQLDDEETAMVRQHLKDKLNLGTDEQEFSIILQQFLEMNDDNFSIRERFFYEYITPHLALYAIPIGGTLTITGLTRAGYVRNVNVPVYGTFQFKSLEKSALSGGQNLMDMMTFRDLYGFGTADRVEENAEIKKEFGVVEVARENADEALFGGEDAAIVSDSATTGFDEFKNVDLQGAQRYTQALLERIYTSDEINTGVALNAAIMLKDPTRLDETVAVINRVSQEKNLGIQAVTWRAASGLVGQFITLVRAVLYVAIFIIFVVALVIINNSMVMATLERVREIGTMRAIGAQRGFVLWMLLVETAAISLFFGGVGAMAGSGLVLTLGQVGIPAGADILVFLFSGPRLYPFLAPIHLVIAFFVLLGVSVASTFYPALIAMRVTPLQAMQEEE